MGEKPLKSVDFRGFLLDNMNRMCDMFGFAARRSSNSQPKADAAAAFSECRILRPIAQKNKRTEGMILPLFIGTNVHNVLN